MANNILINRSISRDIHWTGGHWNLGRTEIIGIEESDYDNFSIRVVDKNSESDLHSTTIGNLIRFREEGSNVPKPDFNNGQGSHGISITTEFDEHTRSFYINLSMNYKSDQRGSGAEDLFSNGDFSFDIVLFEKEDRYVLQSVNLSDMSQNAIEARRIRKDSKYTEWKFWIGFVLGIPAKTFAGWLAIVFAVTKEPSMLINYPFLNDIVHPTNVVIMMFVLGSVGYCVSKMINAPEELKKIQRTK